MYQLSEEMHLLKQHFDEKFAGQREHLELVVARERAELKLALQEHINEKIDVARKETDAKLADFRRDMDRKFMWMIAALVGVIAGQVALFFR